MADQTEREIKVFADAASMAADAAQRFVTLAREAIADHGRFRVALSGGSTPKLLHQILASKYHDDVDWGLVEVFWGDERFVAPDHPDSCYLMARETLLDHVPIPAANIYIMPTVGDTPEASANSYGETLKSVFGEDVPRFDLIFLGMGPDGHTASLFPHQPEVVNPSDALVAPVFDSPKPPPTRLTLTYRVLNNAAQVVFLVGGADKADTVREVLFGEPNSAEYPSQAVKPSNGHLAWLLDNAAAAKISVA
jgi:6-phosphogluconolactonase